MNSIDVSKKIKSFAGNVSEQKPGYGEFKLDMA